MDSSNQKTIDFSEVRAALLNNEVPFPAGLLYFFSDISFEDLKKVSEVWPKVRVRRRRALLEDMENLAEADTLLFFDHFAISCLEDDDPVARATAIRLLWQSQEEELVPLLLKRMLEDPEAIVRAAAATGLGMFVYLGECEEIKTSTYEDLLENLIQTHLGSDDVLVRRRALEALGYASHPDIPDFIQKTYDTNDEDWLQSALLAMGRSYDKRWIEPVVRMLDHPDPMVQYEAVRAAGELEAQEARDLLFDLLDTGTDDQDLLFAAIWSLTKIGGQGVRELIEMSLEETSDPEEQQFLEEALENLDFTEQVSAFDMMVFEEDPEDWADDEFENEDV
ncbi:MAG: HEAT repeat domain-containing protein [Chloroflexota bacterium]|nr:HEAT repeat domain-containing protein [Chloroflexota bacterium]